MTTVMMVTHAPGDYDPDRVAHWWPAMAVSLLTAANEALLIAEALGVPAWLASARRVYGFVIILALFTVEVLPHRGGIACLGRNISAILQNLVDLPVRRSRRPHCGWCHLLPCESSPHVCAQVDAQGHRSQGGNRREFEQVKGEEIAMK